MKVACCMMVHCPNTEMENYFMRCLRSLRGQVDELNVVATKKDRTQEIALAWAESNPGVKVHTVYEPWAMDFSKHRNTSLGMVSEDMDWILVMDSDEEFLSFFDLRMWLKSLGPEVMAVAVKLHDNRSDKDCMETTQPRLFRRGQVHYESTVHNQPIFPGMTSVASPFHEVRHYGYGLSPESLAAKWDRSEAMIRANMKKDPAWAKGWFYLMQVAGLRGDYAGVVEYGQRYMEHREQEGALFFSGVFFSVLQAYRTMGDTEGMGRVLRQGLAEVPDDADLNLALADYGVMTNNEALVGKGSANYCRAYKRHMDSPASLGTNISYTLNPDFYALSRYRLAVFHLKRGVDNWRELAAMVEQVSEPLRKQIHEGAVGNLEAIGLSLPTDWILPKTKLAMVGRR